MRRFSIHVNGRVQGVYFRKYTAEGAAQLGIVGFVQNQPDGSVYCEAEGGEAELQMFLDWVGQGSPMSEIRSMDVQALPFHGFEAFEIRKTSSS